MMAGPSQTPPAPAAENRAGGMRQSLRVLCFGIAAVIFAACTFLAFFRTPFPPPNAPAPAFLSGAWWLRPIEFNSASRLHQVPPGTEFNCISALVGGRHVWIGGSGGLLIHSQDDGRTWEQLPVVTASPVPMATPARPAAAAANRPPRADIFEKDEIIRVAQPAETPAPQPFTPEQRPLDVQQMEPNQMAPNQMAPNQMAPNQMAPPPEVQQKGAPDQDLLFAPDTQMRALLSNNLVDLQFVTEQLGYAVTDAGDILSSNDGGESWRLLRPVDLAFGFPNRARFADERRGIMMGQFGVASTDDGGETWSAAAPAGSLVTDAVLLDGLNGLAVGLFPEIVQIVDNGASVEIGERYPVAGVSSSAPQFTRICRAGPQTVFAASSEGFVARSASGGPWQAFDTGAGAALQGLFFISDRVGWAASGDGRVFRTNDRGETWTRQDTGTQAVLRDIYFASEDRGLIVGRDAALLATEDGGATWRPLVTTSASGRPGRHAWLPPPWYFAAVLLLFGFVRRIPEETRPPTREGIGQILVTDKPLAAEDPDYLGFREVAWGLSNYLRNKATKPPLTVAITGAWGTGKSSLMNLLHADLVHYKFRPVWFNAWHHQTEEHLLAALLENIRKQAIPSVISPEGLVFRARLLWVRARQHLLLTLVIVAAATLALSFYLHGQYTFVDALLDLTSALKKPSEIPERIARSSEAGKAIVAFSAALASLIALAKTLTPFGLNPASLLASRSNSARAADLRAQTSFRHKFAVEFREVTESLNPLTMVIFIDDLDRCRPEQVYDMLESINFLVSCGDCFVIMGLARRRVENCVGLVFEKVAAEEREESEETAPDEWERRRRFASDYLEKLINIEVPVPKGEPEQIRTLLKSEPIEIEPPGRWERLGRKFNDWLPHFVPLALSLLVVLLAAWMGQLLFKPDQTRGEKSRAVAQTDSAQPSVSEPAQGFTPPPTDLMPEATAAPKLGGASFTPGRRGGAPWWAVVLVGGAILVPGIIRLSRRSGSVIEDSPAFVQALEHWFPFLAAERDLTPRSVKRFVNRVRYFAMMEGSFQPAQRWWEQLAGFFRRAPAVPAAATRGETQEELLVALATLHERHPEWFAGDFASFQDEVAARRIPRQEELLQVDEALFRHFQKLVAGVEVH